MMKCLLTLLALLVLLLSPLPATEPRLMIREEFGAELSPDWFWELGTWTAKDGLLRGYESGLRRHGPIKLRKYPPTANIVECEFRLEGKATFASIIFNGAQARGHIVHVVLGKDSLSIIAHPKPGEKTELLRQHHAIAVGDV